MKTTKNKSSGYSIIFIFILILTLAAAGILGWMTYQDYHTHKAARTEYINVINENVSPTETANVIAKAITQMDADMPLYPERDIDWYELKETNKDYIGWLYFPFFGVTEADSFTLDYPIVYEHYANQYLRTTFEGTSNTAGCIFMDVKSNPSFFGYNDIIYGHHMRDKSMFGALEKVHQMDNLEYLKENPQYLYVYTKTACHKYVLVAYEQVENSNNIAYGVASENSTYDQLKENIRGLDTYMPSNDFTWKGRPEILNLSTCDGPSGTSKRFILHFVKIMAYEYEK